MLKRFVVENYRAFVQPVEIDLRPITLLYGYNHVGKSALLRFLPLLSDSATGRHDGHLALDSETVRGASYDDLRSRQSDNTAIKFSVLGDLPDYLHVQCIYIIDSLPGSQHYVRRFELSWQRPGQPDVRFTASWEPRPLSPDLSQTMALQLQTKDHPTQKALAQLRFRGLTPALCGEHPALTWAQQPLSVLAAFLEDLDREVQWLGALRRPPPRRTRLRAGAVPPRKLSSDGSGTAEMLGFDHAQGGELGRQLEPWFRGEAAVAEQRLVVRPTADDVRIRISPWGSPGVEVDLADAGEGMTHILPVLVATARAYRSNAGDPRLVAVEQPELHLHPRREIALASHLARIAASPNPPTLLLETHSENLLLALQIEVAEGRLDPSLLGIYWIAQLEDGSSRAKPLEIDHVGRIKGWPRGVFEEDSALARKLVEARMKVPR